MNQKTLILEKLKNLRDVSGVYLWKNPEGEVLYVGKAIDLQKRLRSYLKFPHPDPKTSFLQSEIHDLDWIVTASEKEALLLEASLIKKYTPKYNILLKDDKKYPYICVSTKEPFPMVFLTRKPKENGNRYFGPFSDVKSARDTLQLIHKTFPVRKTKLKLPLAKPQRPCLNFHMKRCLGPCQGNVPEAEYNLMISEIIKFLEGRKEILLKSLESNMKQYSEKMKYETAMRYRDMITTVKKFHERQTVISMLGEDEDVLGLATRENEGQVIVFEIREGRLDSKKAFPLTGVLNSKREDILIAFLRDYYLKTPIVPRNIYTKEQLRGEDFDFLLHYFTETLGFIPKIRAVTGGRIKSLVSLADKNAEISLNERILATKLKDQTKALKEIQDKLHLKDTPRIIECYDISHIQGFEPVASGVMFVDGKPYNSGYRHYKIRGYEGINDPGMMHEVISRRLQRLLNENEKLPDLVVIDGGNTQLARACEAAIALDLGDIPFVGLAKKREEIYFPGNSDPYQFPLDSPMMKLLRHIRDEAHRFGVQYHRKRRAITSMKTILDEIPEIGKSKRTVLLKYFSGKKKVEDATFEELVQVKGIGESTAKKILEKLQKE